MGLIAAAVAVGALLGVAGVYGIGGLTRNAGDPACRPTFDLARKIEPFAKGEVAALTPAARPLMVPDLVFKDATGTQRKLSDWRGRTVLLNLWATWCVPCRKEMPALDELQTKLGAKDFEVVAVNIDTRDLEKPKSWLKEAGISSLGYFSDEKAKVFQDLKLIGKAFGMPTSILIDASGCEVGTIAGPAEWASDDALKLVRAALGR
jgi:thiol-disulfide isomerase/thioredoxin